MLVNCVAYQDGRRVGDVPVDGIHSQLATPGRFVWVALKDPTSAELEAMQAEFDLHDLSIEDAQQGEQRPKLEEYGQTLFVVLRTLEPHGDEFASGEVALFVGPNWVLSVRRGTERGFADVRARSEQEPELLKHGPAYVLYALMDAVVDRYFPALDAMETELDAIEDRIFANLSARENIEALYCLKRKLAQAKHTIAPMLEAAGKLHGGRVPALCAGLQDYFRDVYDHLLRLNQSLDELRDTVTTALAVNLSLITIQEGEVTKRLAAYAALVAVPTMIAGIYGMNFQHMPELAWRWGYPLALAVMVVIDAWLFWRLRRAGWL